MLPHAATRTAALLSVLLLASFPLTGAAQDQAGGSKDDSSTTELEEMTVYSERDYTTAASTEVRARDFDLRPKNRPGDLLRLTPGLVIAQHQGGGKAEQIFLRGFDADHGTDVALFLDDLPINMRSHAHGQGYADEHLIIPETIEKVVILKGPYDVSLGDFATAGSVRFVTKRNFEEGSLTSTGGMWDTQRYVAAMSRTIDGADVLGAFEYYFSDGPFENPGDYSRFNGLAKATLPTGDHADLTVWFSGYSGDWHGSGQIPERAVASGLIDRFGSIDPSEGGHTQRYSAEIAFDDRFTSHDNLHASVYYSYYALQLWNDFTFFLRDPVNGDEIEQDDKRNLFGANAEYTHVFGDREKGAKLTAGLQTREDFIQVRLGTARGRVPLGTTTRDGVFEASCAGYVSLDAPLAERVRLILGGRGEGYHWDVEDQESQPGNVVDGSRDEPVPGATADLVLGPFKKTHFYLNFGVGHHSNDARAVVGDPTGVALPNLYAYEVGMRTKAFDDRLDLGLGAFLYDLESELVENQDTATLTPEGPTRRVGVELEQRLRILDWLFFDGDLSYTEGWFTQDHDNIPLAPNWLGRAGLTARFPFGLESSLQMRYLGKRWGDDEGAFRIPGYTVFDLSLKYRVPKKPGDEKGTFLNRMEAFVNIENLFDTEWREGQFVNQSRLPAEPPGGVTDVHFTPGDPITVMGGITIHF